MASKITSPESSNKTGISVQTIVNASLATNAAVASMPSTRSTGIETPPIGPDGKPYIRNVGGTAWIPQSNKPPMTNEDINALTKNGTDTSNILKNGLPVPLGENIPVVLT